MKTSDFFYDLPPELIAQEPSPERAQSRMLVVHRSRGNLEHKRISDLPDYLKPGDLLVLNNTRVIPARLFGKRSDTGGKVELLLLEELASDAALPRHWDALYKASTRPRQGLRLSLANGRIAAEIVAVGGEGHVTIGLSGDKPIAEIMEDEGFAPLPPYIKRPTVLSPMAKSDRERYQTVYARIPGAIAAPTAGLHFSEELLNKLEARGIKRTEVTLHVGPGTFKPVKTELVEEHSIEPERYTVTQPAADSVNSARHSGGRIVAVGTTTVRTLETAATKDGQILPGLGRSSLFIYPGYSFRAVDALLTNFHLPGSTLLMLACAFAERKLILPAYKEAINERYRFYSYGDCMLIL